jgi:hypothetical protein
VTILDGTFTMEGGTISRLSEGSLPLVSIDTSATKFSKTGGSIGGPIEVTYGKQIDSATDAGETVIAERVGWGNWRYTPETSWHEVEE